MTWASLPPDLQELATQVLTAKQLEVIRYEADGMTVRYTARQMRIAPSTVQSHRVAAHQRLVDHITSKETK